MRRDAWWNVGCIAAFLIGALVLPWKIGSVVMITAGAVWWFKKMEE